MRQFPAAELLELSLAFELNAQRLYERLAVDFAAQPDAAAFWREYALDEGYHARLLNDLKARLSTEQLASMIESDLVGDTRRMLQSLQKDPHIEDLNQAYDYANMIEHSEINPLFETVLAAFEPDPQALERLKKQLNEHIDKLIYKFPQRFSRPEQRREIKV